VATVPQADGVGEEFSSVLYVSPHGVRIAQDLDISVLSVDGAHLSGLYKGKVRFNFGRRYRYRSGCSLRCRSALSSRQGSVTPLITAFWPPACMFYASVCLQIISVSCLDPDHKVVLIGFLVGASEDEAGVRALLRGVKGGVGSERERFFTQDSIVLLSDRGKAIVAGVAKELPSATHL
jgi:hypothetical protein